MTRILFLSENEDLKKQISLYMPNAEIISSDPDIVIIDEDESKVKDYVGLPIIFISKEKEQENAINIKKPISLTDLLEKLMSCQKVFENNSDFSLSWGNFVLVINKKELYNKKFETSYKLTEKEVDILKYFYKNQERFISKKEMLEEVWGYNPEMSTHTTETHIYRLRQKVEPTSEVVIETKDGEYKLMLSL